MNVWETDPHMREHLGGIVGMRVLPMNCRNIRNIIYINKNIYKKQIDNRNLIITATGTYRNVPEHFYLCCSGNVPATQFSGTSLQAL